MKSKYKIVSLLVVSVLTANTAGLLVPRIILANETDNNTHTPFNIISVSPNNTNVGEGDFFSLTIELDTSEELFENIEQGIQLYISENTVDYSSATVQIKDRETKTIEISGLEYTGIGKSFGLELGYVGTLGATSKNLWTESAYYVSLDEAKPIEYTQISESLQLISPKIINVVAGESQQIRIMVQNTSEATSEKGTITFELEDKEVAKSIDLNKEEVTVPRLDRNEREEIALTLDIAEDLPIGIYNLIMNIDGNTQILQLKVDSDFMPASLQVDLMYTENFEENIPKSANLVVKNVGHVAAKNITAKFTGDNIAVTNGSNVKYIENIASGNSVNIPVVLMVSDSTQHFLPLELELTYLDDQGNEKISNHTITLNTKGTLPHKEVTVTTTAEPTGTIEIGEAFDVGFNVVAVDGAENIIFTVEPTGGIVPKTKNLFVEPKLEKGETKDYEVTFVAPQEVVTGTYAIGITANYTLNGEETEVKSYATVFVENSPLEEDEESGSNTEGKPIVIIENYATTPTIVQAGQQFILDLGFKNTHVNQEITNFKANLTITDQGENNTGSVFTPVGASNTFFISNIAPGQIVDEQITMYTLPSADPKTYEVTLEMKYTDEEGNEISETEYIGIPVEQVTQIEVAEVQTEMVEVGMSVDLTAIIYNTGKTDINNVMVTVEGEKFGVQDATSFEGLFQRGADIMFRPTLIPHESGLLEGQIIITYEDTTGKENVLVEPFTLEVMEPMPKPEELIDYTEIPEEIEILEESMQINWFSLLGGIIGIGSAAGITSLLLKRRRKKLQELEFYED